MLPDYHRMGGPRALIRIPFPRAALVTIAFPFLSFIFCVVWSLLYFFERSTSTHCSVPNLLPSISAAIGNYEPQRTVWQMAILISTFPRLMFAAHYHHYYNKHIRPNSRPIANVACLLNVTENVALVGLSIWTSAEDYEMHKIFFITFIAVSEIHMLISYYLNKNGRKFISRLTTLEERSLRYKRNLCIVNIGSFIVAAYCFLRHNSHCEPYMYTLFALAEYVVVLSNMAFHMTAAWDFHDKYITFNWTDGFYFSPA